MNNLDNLINNIKEKTACFTDLEQARYVYILLGKMMNFDPHFYFANEKNKTKIYHSFINNVECLNKCCEEKTGICLSLAYLYKYILQVLNINVDIIEYKDDYKAHYNHVYNLIKLKDGRIWKADLQLDLGNIKYNYKTEYFSSNSFIFSQELETIDRKINYINDTKYYANDYNYLLHTIIDELSLNEKLSFLLENLEPYDGENISYVTFKWHVLSKIKKFLTPQERTLILIRDLYYKQNNQKIYTLGIIKPLNNPLIYLYSLENRQFEQVSIHDFSNMLKNNLNSLENLPRKLTKS